MDDLIEKLQVAADKVSNTVKLENDKTAADLHWLMVDLIKEVKEYQFSENILMQDVEDFRKKSLDDLQLALDTIDRYDTNGMSWKEKETVFNDFKWSSYHIEATLKHLKSLKDRYPLK